MCKIAGIDPLINYHFNLGQIAPHFYVKNIFLAEILAELEHFHWQPSLIKVMWPHYMVHCAPLPLAPMTAHCVIKWKGFKCQMFCLLEWAELSYILEFSILPPRTLSKKSALTGDFMIQFIHLTNVHIQNILYICGRAMSK